MHKMEPGANSTSCFVTPNMVVHTTPDCPVVLPQACAPRSERSRNISRSYTANASRRALLRSGVALLSSTCLTGPAVSGELQEFYAPGLYDFSYPKDWVLAYDRTEAGSDGAQVLVVKLPVLDTFSISKETRKDYVNASSLDEILEDLIADVRDTPTSMRFIAYSNETVDRSDGASYLEMEYLVETCRGVVEEESGGVKFCKGPKEMVLQTVSRRHLVGVVRGNNVVYVLNAGALENRWGEVGGVVRGVFDSFGLR